MTSTRLRSADATQIIERIGGAWPIGGAPAPAARQAGPSVTEVVQSIQKGQPAAASLSRAGGGPTDTELTPQALAEMSEEGFAGRS
jgi:hypothetical protein